MIPVAVADDNARNVVRVQAHGEHLVAERSGAAPGVPAEDVVLLHPTAVVQRDLAVFALDDADVHREIDDLLLALRIWTRVVGHEAAERYTDEAATLDEPGGILLAGRVVYRVVAQSIRTLVAGREHLRGYRAESTAAGTLG